MMRNDPVPTHEQLRLKALKYYSILDSIDEKEFDQFTKLASIICECPVSFISLIDEKRQWFKSKIGVEESETTREISFCRYTILGDEILEVEDALEDERFKNNEIAIENNLRFYAGSPLIDPNGFTVGTLCVMDIQPKKLNKE